MTRAQRLHLPSDPVQAAYACLAVGQPPGSGDQLRLAASTLARMGSDLRTALSELRRIADLDSTWSGEGADAFRQKVREPARAHLDDVPVRYDAYARALRDYALALDNAQFALVPLRDEVSRALDAQRAHPDDPQWCGHAARRYAERYNEWVDAANRCAAALNRIDRHDHLHNPHGWQAVVDHVSRWAGDLSTVFAVLAVAALSFCPPAAAVLFLASSAGSAVGLAADLDRQIQYGEDVSVTTLCVDALGSVPVTGVAKAGRAGYAAARATGDSATAMVEGTRALGGGLKGVVTDTRDALRDAAGELRRGPTHGFQRLGATSVRVGLAEQPDVKIAFAGQSATNAWDNRRKKGFAGYAPTAPLRVVWAPVADVTQ